MVRRCEGGGTSHLARPLDSNLCEVSAIGKTCRLLSAVPPLTPEEAPRRGHQRGGLEYRPDYLVVNLEVVSPP